MRVFTPGPEDQDDGPGLWRAIACIAIALAIAIGWRVICNPSLEALRMRQVLGETLAAWTKPQPEVPR